MENMFLINEKSLIDRGVVIISSFQTYTYIYESRNP